MSEHTKEPWRIGRPPPNGEQTIGDEKGLMVAVATTGHGVSSKANARRIVACVNALENVSTEWLEAQSGIVCLGSPIKDRFLELEQQRDQLLEIMHRVEEDLIVGTSDDLTLAGHIRDAINSVKGGAA